MDHSLDAYDAERLQSTDTLLLGATSYSLFKASGPR
jgi:hypothetical protein